MSQMSAVFVDLSVFNVVVEAIIAVWQPPVVAAGGGGARRVATTIKVEALRWPLPA